jgi:DNA-binding NarL/FixJ family response regulator
MEEILDAGATGYLLKRTSPEELIRAIHVVHNGGMYLDPAVAHRFVGNGGRGSNGRGVQRAQLSEREAEVARLIALGYSNKEIGAQMNLSVKTIETYKARLLTKLDLRSRADIVRHAIDHGWLDNHKPA